MLLRVLVDVGNHVPELAVSGDGYASKGVLEQASSSAISFVDGFGVGIEEIGEFLRQVIRL